ncbi:MAG: hypothetical protein ACE1Y4_16050 [Lysobacterales bacterium]
MSERRVVVLSAAFATVLALLAIYIGRPAEPYREFPLSALSLSFGFSIDIACFKALMYIQQRAAQLPMSCLPIPGDWRCTSQALTSGASSSLLVALYQFDLVAVGTLGTQYNLLGIGHFNALLHLQAGRKAGWFWVRLVAIMLEARCSHAG